MDDSCAPIVAPIAAVLSIAVFRLLYGLRRIVSGACNPLSARSGVAAALATRLRLFRRLAGEFIPREDARLLVHLEHESDSGSIRFWLTFSSTGMASSRPRDPVMCVLSRL